ncbi:MAG: TIGR02147 family protein [Deltaproteobacteria bacterium]|nr:TIGR02147 family protein [Deltaproteobacteria bacterium]
MQHFYQQCLKEELARRIGDNPSYSMRAFARALKMPSGALSEVIQGRRRISYKLANRMTDALDLNITDQRRFILSTAEASFSGTRKRFDPHFRRVIQNSTAAVSSDTTLSLEHDLFQAIADWYHYAILELTHTQGFRSDSAWIATQLGISRPETQAAIERLIRLKLLSVKNGRLVKNQPLLRTSDRSLTTPALRRRQRQILERSIRSLENDPIETRNHTAMTMAIDPTLLPKAKERIDQFQNDLCQFLEKGKRKRVYELTVNLFPLQRGQDENP